METQRINTNRHKNPQTVAAQERDCPLELLDICNNGIGSKGAESLAKLLEGKAVKELRAYMNDFGDAGMKPISAALKKNHSALESLEMGGNNVAAAGVTLLMDALSGSTTLKKLDLGYAPTRAHSLPELPRQCSAGRTGFRTWLWLASSAGSSRHVGVRAPDFLLFCASACRY